MEKIMKKLFIALCIALSTAFVGCSAIDCNCEDCNCENCECIDGKCECTGCDEVIDPVAEPEDLLDTPEIDDL
jgi:hypothetical protein